jgi:signal transduction histidine kinase
VSRIPNTLDSDRPIVAGGEMGDLMRALDWAATPVGPPQTWPQSLRTAISILLDSRFPMLALWGPELVQFYNDAFRPILGHNKHPAALGQRARECWLEIWDVIGPMFDGVMARDQATFAEDLLFFLDRNGYLEETYFTFCYSAIRDESNAPGGVLVTCVETTAHVIGERRLHILRELADRAANAEVADAAATAAALTLGGNAADVPFALVYLFDAARQAHLVGTSALQPNSAAAPLATSPRLESGVSSADPWELASVTATGRASIVQIPTAELGGLQGGPWTEPPRRALVLPIPDPGQTLPTGALVVGLSPHLPFDDAYRGFLELAAGHTGTAIANARAREAQAEADAERERRFAAERRSREAIERVHRHLVVRDAVGVVLMEATLEDGPPRILDEICHGFGWDWGVFWEVDAEGSALRPIATWASPDLDAGAFEAATRAMAFERGGGLPGRAWATGRPIRVSDVRRHPAFARRAAVVASGLRGGIELPVRSGGHVVAVLELMTRERRRIDAEMLAALQAIGAKVGQFVERRHAEEALRRSEAAERTARLAAEAAVKARDEVVATVSHDLSNPLTAIKATVQLLRRRVQRGIASEPAQLDERFAALEGAVADMERLIRDLLDAAQLQAGRPLDLRRQPADLVALAGECVAAYEKLSDRHRVCVLADAPTAQGYWDVARVQRVVANLIGNAIKYSPAGGEVIVSVEVDGDAAVLTVRDEGLGIPAADLPHIFERFHRGSNVERISGTGIGLAGAKDIVEQHGGRIAVTSIEGRGTTVAVRLPLSAG